MNAPCNDELTEGEENGGEGAVADRIDCPPRLSRLVLVTLMMLAGMGLQGWGYHSLRRSFRPRFVETTYRWATQQEFDRIPLEGTWVEVARQNDWDPKGPKFSETRAPSKMTLVWQKRLQLFLTGAAGTVMILGIGYWHAGSWKMPLLAVLVGPMAIIWTLQDE